MIDSYEYGKAIFELAQEQSVTSELLEQLEAVVQILGEHPDYVTLLDTPAVPAQEKPALIDAAFAQCHVYVRDFMKILSAGSAIGQLEACVEVYRRCLDESLGILRAEAVTMVPMTDAQCNRLEQKLAGMTGKRVILTNRCDDTVLGGVELVCDGTRFDGSIRSRLEALRRDLKAVRV